MSYLALFTEVSEVYIVLYYENKKKKMLVNVFNAASFMMTVQCFKNLLYVVRYLAVSLFHYYVDLIILLQKSKLHSFPYIKAICRSY